MDWDYLIVTAANAQQGEAYEWQLRLRREAGELARIREVLVVPDLEGRRIGSGASTIECLRAVHNREAATHGLPAGIEPAEAVLRRLRILIVHAGGDSRRLPAYSACGKLFVPLPGGNTLFERLLSVFLQARPGPPGLGQIVVAAGDALIDFDPSAVNLSRPGITALGALVTPEEASRHGVLCPGPDGSLRVYFQKPAIPEQRAAGAIRADGRSVIDLAVMSIDAPTAVALLRLFCEPAGESLAWKHEFHDAVLARGLDLYREICCAMGTEATAAHYIRTAHDSGTAWPETVLARLFPELHAIPVHVQVPDSCLFLHFGTTRQLISSGLSLVARDRGHAPDSTVLTMNTGFGPGGSVSGSEAWLEACRVRAPLRLGGENVLVGVDVGEPLELPRGACLDVSQGSSRAGEPVWFVRCCGVRDTFKHPAGDGATFCGVPLNEWLSAAEMEHDAVWEDDAPPARRTLWNARVFPAERERGGYRRWLWMFDPGAATPAQKRALMEADRYSAAEIALLVDQEAFYAEHRALDPKVQSAALDEAMQ